MAATITSDAFATSGGTPINIDAGGNSLVSANAGEWFLILIATSNDGTNGATCFTNCDAQGNAAGKVTLTTRENALYDPGAAGAGANAIIVTGEVTASFTDGTIFANFSPSASQCGIQVYKYAPGAGETISYVSSGQGAGANATSFGPGAISVTNGHTFTGIAAIETDDAITGDSDTTNGSWSSIVSRLQDAGADASCMVCSSQYKTVNATGNQDWAATLSTARDGITAWIILKSVGGAFTLAADAGSYSLTGSAATLKAGRYISAVSGVYSISGLAASLVHGFTMAADFGAYIITGNAASLVASRRIDAAAGVYVLSGFDAALRAARRITAELGVYSISGLDAGLGAGRKIAADFGVYNLTGFDATLTGPSGAFTIAADAGAYSLIGSAAALLAARRLAADPGVYTIIGSDAALSQGGAAPADERVSRQPILFLGQFGLHR